MQPISPHISWEEAVASPTAARLKIDNTPNGTIISNMVAVANEWEKLREWYGQPINIDDFYRCPALNTAVGGVADSQHMTGQAIDFSVDPDTNLKLIQWAKDNLDYDQLINEYPDAQGRPKWIHLSFIMPVANRHEYLTIT
jgi:zinc D-Ala-D-Ala carboxypeptidase